MPVKPLKLELNQGMTYQRPKRPFAWSYSRLKNYRACPKRSYHLDIAKDIVEPPSEPLVWGNEVHQAMDNLINKGTPLPPMMTRFEEWPRNVLKLRDMGIKVVAERNLAMTEKFMACQNFAPDAWFRCKVDVTIELPDYEACITIDWKTGGNVLPDSEQLALSAQAIFANYPWCNHVIGIFVWFGHDTQTVLRYSRDDMVPLWNKLLPEIKQMRLAYEMVDYPPTPNGLCKRYCPVTSCPFHGRGSQ